jgi:hypothetical protein
LSEARGQRTDEAGDGNDRNELDQEARRVEHGGRLQRLLAAEARLDRSFAACLLSAVAGLTWPTYLRLTGQAYGGGAGSVSAALVGAFALTYVWFAVSVARAVHALRQRPAAYVAWLASAPVLWLLLPIPVLATAILASPLSLKLLLSRQLRSEIHDVTFAP